jgi:hypothetical protein
MFNVALNGESFDEVPSTAHEFEGIGGESALSSDDIEDFLSKGTRRQLASR